MKTYVRFDKEREALIRDGFFEIHRKVYDDTSQVLQYDQIDAYILAGKKVKRRRAWNNFFNAWGGVLFWVIFIGGMIAWSSFSQQKESDYNHTTNQDGDYSNSSSGISYDETCPITTCNDGACSSSTGRGTCSYHGGVRN